MKCFENVFNNSISRVRFSSAQNRIALFGIITKYCQYSDIQKFSYFHSILNVWHYFGKIIFNNNTCYCDCLQGFANVVFGFALVVAELYRVIVLCANVLKLFACFSELCILYISLDALEISNLLQFVWIILYIIKPQCGNCFTLSEETERRVRLCLCLTLKVKVRACFFLELICLEVTIEKKSKRGEH